MLTYAAKRLGLALLVALAVSVISFALLRASSDVAAAVAGEAATAADIEFIRKAYGFDRPLIVQYFDWLGRTLTGDFGQSLYYKKEVADIVLSKLPVTLVLSATSLVLAVVISIPLGVIAAVYPNTWIDRLALLIAVIGQALPSFWFSLVLIMLFSLTLRWLPVSGSDTWAHYVMPSIALAYYVMPLIMRLTRAGMMEVLGADFVRTARAKGLSPASVVFKHALRNAIIPVVAVTAVCLGFMLGGSIVIETVFALDGLGYLAWQSIRHNDFPVTQAIVLLLSVLYIALTLLADLLNGWLDPRIRVR